MKGSCLTGTIKKEAEKHTRCVCCNERNEGGRGGIWDIYRQRTKKKAEKNNGKTEEINEEEEAEAEVELGLRKEKESAEEIKVTVIS